MRELLLEKETILAKNLIEPHLDDYAVLISVHYSYISSGVQASLLADAKRTMTTFGNVPQKIKSILSSLMTSEKNKEKFPTSVATQAQAPLLGYSCSGKVIAAGKKVTTFKTGDYVACLGGDYIQYQDIVCVPVGCVAPIRNADFLKKGSIVALGATALRALRLAELQLGEIVCVLGLGVIGQCIAQLAKQSGCTVVGIDLLQDRISIALASGIEYAFDAHDSSLRVQIGIITNNKGFDATFVASSHTSDEVMESALEFTRSKGKIVVIGTIGMNIQKEHLHKREVTVIMVNSADIGASNSSSRQMSHEAEYQGMRWTIQGNMQAVVHMIERGTLVVDDFIKREEAFQDIDKTYFELKNRRVLGVLVKYAQKSNAQFVPATIDSTYPVAADFKYIDKGKVVVGIVGATGLECCSFLPTLSKMSSVSVHAVSGYTASYAQSVARKLGATKIFTHEEKLYKDQDIDAVIITSSDSLHAQQALTALSSGKAVFMTKPMVTNFEEYEQFAGYFKKASFVPLCVEYSYSFSSLIHKIKWETSQRLSPLMIRYRISRDFLTVQGGIQKGNSAGSVIDEASAIFELFSFLTDSYPIAVSAEVLRSSLKNCFPTDNFSVQLSFSDGSVCSLLFTSLANSATSQDHMEIFFDGKTIELTDFMTLKGYGIASRNFDTQLLVPDRGAEQLLHHFINGITHKEAKMPFSSERLTTIAHLTLVVDKLVCQGGGTETILQS